MTCTEKSPLTIGECLDDGREDSGMAEALDKEKGIGTAARYRTTQQFTRRGLPARINYQLYLRTQWAA